MKKTASIIASFVCFCFPLFSGPVGPERALIAAEGFFGIQPETRSSDELNIVWDGENDDTRGTVDPSFYVIERSGGGFVILAADDEVVPVLAFSDHNYFGSGPVPSHVAWWMDRIKVFIRSSASRTPAAHSQWAELETRTRTSGPLDGVTDKFEHLTPEWNQRKGGKNDEDVFNAKCPVDNGVHTITGCTAVAMAEVLTTLSGLYPEDMPSRGRGFVGGYDVAEGCLAPDKYELDTEYDWAGLRSLIDINAVENATPELQENLAQLLADCGAAAGARYTTTGTSAPLCPPPLIEHFYMSPNALDLYEYEYTVREWSDLLKEELMKHPVLYCGYPAGEGLGHAFVLDGLGTYKGDDVFHVNFGWGGSYNGYYLYTAIKPGNLDYTDSVSAIFNMVPDARGLIAPKYKLELFDGGGIIGLDHIHGIVRSDTEAIRKDESFNVTSIIYNSGSGDYSGTIRLVLVDYDGNKKQEVDVTDINLPAGSIIFYNPDCIISVDPCLGDKLVLEYSEGDSSWKSFAYPNTGYVFGEVPVIPAPFIYTDKSYSQGDWFIFKLQNIDYQYAGTVWTITDPNGDKSVFHQKTGGALLSQSGKYIIRAAVATAPGENCIHNIQTTITVK